MIARAAVTASCEVTENPPGARLMTFRVAISRNRVKMNGRNGRPRSPMMPPVSTPSIMP